MHLVRPSSAAWTRMPFRMPQPLLAWQRRHRGLVVVMAVQAALIAAAPVVREPGLALGAAGGLLGAAAATVVAWSDWLPRRTRMLLCAGGLVVCSIALPASVPGLPLGYLHAFATVALLSVYRSPLALSFGLAIPVGHIALAGLGLGGGIPGATSSFAGSPVILAAYIGWLALATAVQSLETALSEVERRSVARVVDATSEGILEVDAAGRITFANATAGRLIGQPPDHLLGLDLHTATGHTGPSLAVYDRLRCPVCRLVDAAEGVPVTGQRFRQPTGRVFPVEFVATRTDPTGGQTTRVVTFWDCETQQRLRDMALHDGLTKLPTRQKLLEHMAVALRRLERYEGAVAVLFVNLDRFGVVNDSAGHGVGDQVLAEVAGRLSDAVRTQDTVARLGGDEFALLCTDVQDEHHGAMIARRVLGALTRPVRVGALDVPLSASVGLAWTRAHALPADELLRDADAAMRRAKGAGGGRFEVFDARMRARVSDRLRTENELRRGIENQHFRLDYQPKISLQDGRVVGLEALVRWHHPQRGIVSPAEFIPVAEDSGLIVPIGSWVLEQACRAAQTWRGQIPAHSRLVIAVNLSGRQLTQHDLVRTVADTLERTGTDPSTVCLEITESVVMDDVSATTTLLRELKALGVRLAIDDFGTGYSSLSYLSQFPLDILKIDRSFVKGLGTEPQSQSIAAAVVGLAEALGLETVAEGVETHEQLALLCELDCDLAQGFLFARPTPERKVPDLLVSGVGWSPGPHHLGPPTMHVTG